jgi:hypothetical protein
MLSAQVLEQKDNELLAKSRQLVERDHELNAFNKSHEQLSEQLHLCKAAPRIAVTLLLPPSVS